MSLPTATTSPDYQTIELGIRNLVKAINRLGVVTYASCEGHEDMFRSGIPYVVIVYEQCPQHALNLFMRGVGFFNREHERERTWAIIPDTRWSGDGSAMISLMPLQAFGCREPGAQKRYQEDGEEIARLLNRMYHLYGTSP